jgi:hypothetical protein
MFVEKEFRYGIRPAPLRCICRMSAESEYIAPKGVEHPGVIDLMLHDPAEGSVTLVMVEKRPWDGTPARLFQLQEKLNAYVSFALDGEMAEAYPSLAHLPLRLRLDCVTEPDPQTAAMLEMVREQIAFQGIALEVDWHDGALS